MKTKRFNIFDVLIILVVAVIVAGAVFRAEIRQMFFTDESIEITIDVKVSFLENSRVATLKEGGNVSYSNGEHFGTIAAITATPSKDIVTVDGVDKDVLSSRCKDVTMEIAVKGYIADGMYYTNNGTLLMLNDSISLETDLLLLNCKITDVRTTAKP